MPKTILITGANGSLGTVVVKKFLAEKYKVIAVDYADNHLTFASGNPLFSFHAVNLSDEKQSEAFVQQLTTGNNRIEGGLFLAGGFAMGDLESTDSEALKKMFSLN